MDVLQVRTGGHEGGVVGGFLLHVPEVAHALDTGAVGIAADGGGIAHQAHVEGFLTVERFQNDGGSAADGEFSEVMELGAEEVAGFQRVREGGSLPIEHRNHDNARGAEFTRGADDVPHGRVELRFHGGVFGQDKAVEAGTDGRDLDVTAIQGLPDLRDPAGKALATGFEAGNAQAFHEVQLLGQGLARSHALLEGKVQRRGRGFFLLLGRSAGDDGAGRSHEGGRTGERGLQKGFPIHTCVLFARTGNRNGIFTHIHLAQLQLL